MCRKIKDPKHNMRVLPKPNVQKLILNKKSPTKAWGIALRLSPKKCPTHPLTWKRKVGAKVGFKEQN